jgi:broad specificity phosphatase PhoE
MEIILLRHGKPTVELKGYIDAGELKALVLAYTQSEIQELSSSHELGKVKKIFNSHYVVCSNLSRSLRSAKMIGFEQIHFSDALFNEPNIPHFDKGFIKLPVLVWLIGLRLMWLFGFSKNAESFKQAKFRAEQASNKLIELAQENEKVILVGHGLMNRLIARQLRLKDWLGPASPGKKYWEFGKYKK